MNKQKKINNFFLITFTLLCIFIFNINSRAKTYTVEEQVPLGETYSFKGSCRTVDGERLGTNYQYKCTHSTTVNITCKDGAIFGDVYNYTITCTNNSAESSTQPSGNSQNTENDCEAILTSDVVDLLQDVFDIIKFADVILVLVLTIVTFTQAIAKGGDELKKALNVTIKRVIIGIIIFFIPVLIDFVFNAIGLYDTCGIG